MWNKAKKLLSLLLALVMVCSLVAVPVSAADVRTGSETILVNSYAGIDVKFGDEGYFIKIDADNAYNTSLKNLENLVKTTKGQYTINAKDANDKYIKLDVEWTADEANPEFKQTGYINDEGQAQNVWYYFTGKLNPPAGGNYILDLPTPKAYVRVYPVKVAHTLYPEAKTVKADDVTALKDLEGLELPKTVDLSYLKIDEPQSISEAAVYMRSTDTNDMGSPMDAYKLFPPEELVTYIPTERSKAIRSAGATQKADITGWQMDGEELTLEALKEKARSLVDGHEEQLSLTPVYKESVPKWASVVKKGQSVFTLIITKKKMVEKEVTVTKPADIEYGGELENPLIDNYADGVISYVGINGTTYGPSGDKPVNAGDYRVIVTTPKDSDYSGRWASDSFIINPKPIKFTKDKVDVTNEDETWSYYPVEGIKSVPREYDGTFEVKLELDKDLTGQFVKGDYSNKKVTVEVGGNLDSSAVIEDDKGNANNTVTINSIALTGDNAGNYYLSIPEDAEPVGSEGKTPLKITNCIIMPKELTIDTSNVEITNDTPPKLANGLRLEGVVGDEIKINNDEVQVTINDSSTTPKTGTLSNIVLSPSEKVNNYKLEGDNITLSDGKYTISNVKFTEVPSGGGKSAPALDTNFTVTVNNKLVEYTGLDWTGSVTLEDKTLNKELSEYTFKYARQNADGSYDTPTPDKPKNAGIYKVIVSFKESTNFASGDVDTGTTVTIYRSDENKVYNHPISLYPGETREINLSELNLPEGAKIKESAYLPGGAILETGRVETGENSHSFTLNARPVTPEMQTVKSQEITLVLESDNYMEMKVKVTVTVTMDGFNIISPKVNVKKSPVESGTLLEDIVEIEGKTGSVQLERENIPGKFTLREPDLTFADGTYNEVWVLFTSDEPGKCKIPVKVTTNTAFTVGEGVDDEDAINFVIYANSPSNTNLNGLKNFVQTKKPKYTIDGIEYPTDWKSDGKRAFQPKGLPPHDLETEDPWFDWYTFIADLDGSSVKPAANVTVIPVNATPSFNGSGSKVMKAANVTALKNDSEMRSNLGLPNTAVVAYEPVMEYKYANEEFDGTSGTWNISGWQMDGKALTLDALKAKANAAASRDVEVTLTPVFADADVPGWATIASTPAFKLTITPKTPVDVDWAGPADITITYGDALVLGTPTQKDSGGDTDPDGTWDFVYYNEDGTRLSEQPTNAGTYQVQAVLISATHSGASELKTFKIKPKNLNDVLVARVSDEGLVYNKSPQTPEYIVTDSGTSLKVGTDYTIKYADNTNAGTATVTFTGMGNYTGVREETFTIKPLPLTSDQKPIISGTAAAGHVLSASLPGVDAAELEWCWRVDGAEVKEWTAASYEVKPEDSNKAITVTAKAKKNGNYSEASGESESVTVDKFRVTGSVTIKASGTGDDGRIVVGTKLTASASVKPSAAENRGVWSWIVDGVEKGDGNTTYTVRDGDKEIVAVFTPNENYTGAIESTVIEVGKILLTGDVTIDASAGTDVGSELTANVIKTPLIDEGQFIYTWLRNGEPIPGADGDTYTIAAGDRGKTISVKVTAEGYTGELVSAGKEIPAVEPGAPAVSVTAGDGKLIINWNAPADNGGAPVTGYKLKVTEEGASDPLLEITLAANVMSYTVEGLTNGKEYSISVSAVNSAGKEGDPCIVDGTPKPLESGGKDDNGNDDNNDSGDDCVPDRRPANGGDSSDDSGNPTVSSTTTTNPDGSKVTIEIKKDNSVVTTVKSTDGRSAVIVTDPSGRTAATVYLPSLVAGRAANGSGIVTLPVQDIYASQNIDRVSTVTVNTSGVNGVKMDIPLVNKGIGVVAILVNPDGTEKIIKNTIPTQNGIAVRLNSGDTIKILDNSMSFADIGGHWANDAVTFVSARGLFYGTKGNIFSPDAEMTRGMLVTVLARYADADTEGGATWYEKSVAWAVANGLSDGTNLDGGITREQLAAIMYRYAMLQGKLSGIGADLQVYTDADSISDWAVDAMSWAVGAGLIKGVAPATLDPQGSASRAQVAAIFMRYAELFGL